MRDPYDHPTGDAERRGPTNKDNRLEEVMRTVVHCLFAFMLLIVVAAPAYSAPPEKAAAPAAPAADHRVIQVWACEVEDGVTEAEVDAMGEAQLKALRAMPGGEGVNLRLLWPVAVNNTGDVDFHVVIEFPSFMAWGKLWDAYDDASPLATLDDAAKDKVACPDSVIWEVHDAVVK
jgi:hypothetical protein